MNIAGWSFADLVLDGNDLCRPVAHLVLDGNTFCLHINFFFESPKSARLKQTISSCFHTEVCKFFSFR